MTSPASVFVVSGPSGAGKGTVIALVQSRLPHVVKAVSVTTRAPRLGECNGREYYFVDREAFREAVAAHEFLEWVEYSHNLYGTLRSEVSDKLAAGDDVILEIELEGARAVKAALPLVKMIFIAPPSFATLAERLQARGTECSDDIACRLEIATHELAAADEFDCVVVNDEAERAATEVIALIESERKGARG